MKQDKIKERIIEELFGDANEIHSRFISMIPYRYLISYYVVRDCELGMSWGQLAIKYDVSKRTIGYILKKNKDC